MPTKLGAIARSFQQELRLGKTQVMKLECNCKANVHTHYASMAAGVRSIENILAVLILGRSTTM